MGNNHIMIHYLCIEIANGCRIRINNRLAFSINENHDGIDTAIIVRVITTMLGTYSTAFEKIIITGKRARLRDDNNLSSLHPVINPTNDVIVSIACALTITTAAELELSIRIADIINEKAARALAAMLAVNTTMFALSVIPFDINEAGAAALAAAVAASTTLELLRLSYAFSAPMPIGKLRVFDSLEQNISLIHRVSPTGTIGEFYERNREVRLRRTLIELCMRPHLALLCSAEYIFRRLVIKTTALLCRRMGPRDDGRPIQYLLSECKFLLSLEYACQRFWHT